MCQARGRARQRAVGFQMPTGSKVAGAEDVDACASKGRGNFKNLHILFLNEAHPGVRTMDQAGRGVFSRKRDMWPRRGARCLLGGRLG